VGVFGKRRSEKDDWNFSDQTGRGKRNVGSIDYRSALGLEKMPIGRTTENGVVDNRGRVRPREGRTNGIGALRTLLRKRKGESRRIT